MIEYAVIYIANHEKIKNVSVIKSYEVLTEYDKNAILAKATALQATSHVVFKNEHVIKYVKGKETKHLIKTQKEN